MYQLAQTPNNNYLVLQWLMTTVVSSVVSSVVAVATTLITGQIKRRRLERIAQGGLVKRGSKIQEYLELLQVGINSAKKTIYLTCFATPDYFLKGENAKSKVKVLRRYQTAHKEGLKVKRIVILSKRKIRKLQRIRAQQAQQPFTVGKKTYKDVVEWFSKINKFTCLWACKERLKKDDIEISRTLFDDYALFDNKIIVRYLLESRQKALIIGFKAALTKNVDNIFELDSPNIYTTFDDLYNSLEQSFVERILTLFRTFANTVKKRTSSLKKGGV